MTLLLETAGHGDTTGAIVTGVAVFLALMVLLAIVTSFGSARPHTRSE